MQHATHLYVSPRCVSRHIKGIWCADTSHRANAAALDDVDIHTRKAVERTIVEPVVLAKLLERSVVQYRWRRKARTHHVVYKRAQLRRKAALQWVSASRFQKTWCEAQRVHAPFAARRPPRLWCIRPAAVRHVGSESNERMEAPINVGLL